MKIYKLSGLTILLFVVSLVALMACSSDPETVAWDLMAQSEHDVDASSVLISTSSQLIQNVKEIIKKEVSSLERCDIISQALLSNGLFINIDNLAESKLSLIHISEPTRPY